MLAFEMGFAGRWELFVVELGGKMSEDRGKDRVVLWVSTGVLGLRIICWESRGSCPSLILTDFGPDLLFVPVGVE